MSALYLARDPPVAVDVQEVPDHRKDIGRPTLSHFSASRRGAIRSIALRVYFTTTCELAMLVEENKGLTDNSKCARLAERRSLFHYTAKQ